MYIIGDIVYANGYNIENEKLKVNKIKVVSNLCMLVFFSNGEKKIFDATKILKYPVYKKLEDFNVFKNATIENGIITWDDGNIDIGTETVYKESYNYEEEIA